MSGMHLSYESVRDESCNQCHPDSRCYPDDSAWLRKAAVFEAGVIHSFIRGLWYPSLHCLWWTWGFDRGPCCGRDGRRTLTSLRLCTEVKPPFLLRSLRSSRLEWHCGNLMHQRLGEDIWVHAQTLEKYRCSAVIFFSSSSFLHKEIHECKGMLGNICHLSNSSEKN